MGYAPLACTLVCWDEPAVGGVQELEVRPWAQGLGDHDSGCRMASTLSREEQRREHNEQKELESLRRVFEQLDKSKDNKIDFKELNDQLIKLDYRAKRVEVEDMIWEVDEDCDHCVSWDEFKLMFQRCRQDKVTMSPQMWPCRPHCSMLARRARGLG